MGLSNVNSRVPLQNYQVNRVIRRERDQQHTGERDPQKEKDGRDQQEKKQNQVPAYNGSYAPEDTTKILKAEVRAENLGIQFVDPATLHTKKESPFPTQSSDVEVLPKTQKAVEKEPRLASLFKKLLG